MVVAENRLQYRENDPLPVDDWVPSVFTEDQGEAMYRQSMTNVQPYVNPLHQFFYQYYSPEFNAEQIAGLCLLWHIAGTCEEAFFLAKWIQPFSDMTSLNVHHVMSIITPPPPLLEYRLGDGTLDILKTVALQLSFQMLLEMWTFQEDQSTGPYEPLRDGDPLTYAASFVDNEMVPVPIQLPMHFTGAW